MLDDYGLRIPGNLATARRQAVLAAQGLSAFSSGDEAVGEENPRQAALLPRPTWRDMSLGWQLYCRSGAIVQLSPQQKPSFQSGRSTRRQRIEILAASQNYPIEVLHDP
jgi:hypothetical protein